MIDPDIKIKQIKYQLQADKVKLEDISEMELLSLLKVLSWAEEEDQQMIVKVCSELRNRGNKLTL